MSIAEVEVWARPYPAAYKRAQRRQKSRSGRDSVVAYLALGQARSYRAGSGHDVDRHRAPEWSLSAVPAYRYAQAQLRRLSAEHVDANLSEPTPRASRRMLHILREVLAEDSVYPTMSADDEGGLIAEWHIGDSSLEIDVDPTGAFSYTVRKEGKRVLGGQSQTPLRKIIRDISALVARVNPNWRSLFPHVAVSLDR